MRLLWCSGKDKIRLFTLLLLTGNCINENLVETVKLVHRFGNFLHYFICLNVGKLFKKLIKTFLQLDKCSFNPLSAKTIQWLSREVHKSVYKILKLHKLFTCQFVFNFNFYWWEAPT